MNEQTKGLFLKFKPKFLFDYISLLFFPKTFVYLHSDFFQT